MGSMSAIHWIVIGIPCVMLFLIIRALWSYIHRNNAHARSEQANTALMQSLLAGQSHAAVKLAELETSIKDSNDRLAKIEIVLKTVD